MEPQSEDVGAFMPGERTIVAPTGSGPLDGLLFGVKDIFDVAGTVTTCGNPDYAATHPPAPTTAPTVGALLSAGARMAGKTKTVELAFGMIGDNPWYGTPRNPRAPDRFPGGSSCGSAAAVAAGLVDFALGSDTGGSVRIPGSFCGLFGIRPTQGAISLAGVMPLAPSLDTPGWFTRSAALLARVGEVLLPGEAGRLAGPLLSVREVWQGAQATVAEALAPALTRLAPLFGPVLDVALIPEGLPALYGAYRALSGEEAWSCHGPWLSAATRRLSPAVAARFEAGRHFGAAEVAPARVLRHALSARLRPLLAGGAVMVYPTCPRPAPLLSATAEELEAERQGTVRGTAVAGLAGLPEVTLPVGEVDGGPVGLSLVAGFGRDRALLALATEAAALLGLD